MDSNGKHWRGSFQDHYAASDVVQLQQKPRADQLSKRLRVVEFKTHVLKSLKILQSLCFQIKPQPQPSARDFQSSFGRILGGSKLSVHQKSDNVLSSIKNVIL